ncbi:MAG: RNA-binding S4 domain-containing protein [Bacteroidales bacterium]|nr:RNA-binding S4 domain-containing protein [Bacteroidales bacterium]MBR6330498.1 RNA-binding S4 domain-containing protein [Bacteroidales bacterium]
MGEIRIDKYLWAVRLYKTRSIATDACRSGRVKLNGLPVKPSHEISVGEIYELNIEQTHRTVQVKELLANRVGAKLVENYLTDLTPPEEYERIQMARQYGFEHRDRGAGRPTKRDRREIEEFKYK